MKRVTSLREARRERLGVERHHDRRIDVVAAAAVVGTEVAGRWAGARRDDREDRDRRLVGQHAAAHDLVAAARDRSGAELHARELLGAALHVELQRRATPAAALLDVGPGGGELAAPDLRDERGVAPLGQGRAQLADRYGLERTDHPLEMLGV